MINLGYAKSFEKSDEQYLIIMAVSGDVFIPVSRGKVKMLKTILGLD